MKNYLNFLEQDTRILLVYIIAAASAGAVTTIILN